MAVAIVREEAWAPAPIAYLFLFFSCFTSLFLLPYFLPPGSSPSSFSPFDLGPSKPFYRFQRRFLLLFSLASVIEGLGSVFGEHQFVGYGIGREEMVLYLAAGAAAALVVGPLLGVVSDVIGPRKACILFYILHLVLGVLKTINKHPSIWLVSTCLALATSVFSFCFETWMVLEHEKQGHRQDLLSDTLWLMFFFESASLIGSQGFANLLVKDLHGSSFSPSFLGGLLAVFSIFYIRKESSASHWTSTIQNYSKSFFGHILRDKRSWILALAQFSVYFSLSVFWILWAPTTVADGRVVHLSLIYPCLLGSRMLGSTAFPWFFATSSLQNEDYLTSAFVVAGLALSVVAYEYQEIGYLVTLFCVFQACVGFILPSLAKLRTMYLPNELRGGMISISLAPANAAILFVLVQGGYYRTLSNSVIFALAALALLSSGGCIYLLRRWRKHPDHSLHSL